jgi:hypothetical protein
MSLAGHGPARAMQGYGLGVGCAGHGLFRVRVRHFLSWKLAGQVMDWAGNWLEWAWAGIIWSWSGLGFELGVGWAMSWDGLETAWTFFGLCMDWAWPVLGLCFAGY